MSQGRAGVGDVGRADGGEGGRVEAEAGGDAVGLARRGDGLGEQLDGDASVAGGVAVLRRRGSAAGFAARWREWVGRLRRPGSGIGGELGGGGRETGGWRGSGRRERRAGVQHGARRLAWQADSTASSPWKFRAWVATDTGSGGCVGRGRAGHARQACARVIVEGYLDRLSYLRRSVRVVMREGRRRDLDRVAGGADALVGRGTGRGDSRARDFAVYRTAGGYRVFPGQSDDLDAGLRRCSARYRDQQRDLPGEHLCGAESATGRRVQNGGRIWWWSFTDFYPAVLVV